MKKKRIKLGAKEIKHMTLFETLSGAKVKDCVQEQNTLGFLVERGDMGLAIGKNGVNILKIRNVMGKGIILMEFFSEDDKFIKNLFQPVEVRNVRVYEDSREDKEKIAVLEVSKRERSRVIGSNGVRIKIARKLAKRHFGINDIKVRVI